MKHNLKAILVSLVVTVPLVAGSAQVAHASAGDCATGYICVYAASPPANGAWGGEYGFVATNHVWSTTLKYSSPYGYLSVPVNDSAWWNRSSSYRACVYHGDFGASGSYKTYDGVAGNYVEGNGTWNDKGQSNRWGAGNGAC